MPPLSIRLRLTIWYSAVLLLALLLFATGIWLTLERRLISGIDEQLTRKVEGISTVVHIEAPEVGANLQKELNEFVAEVPDGSMVGLRDQSGRVLLPIPGRFRLPHSAWSAFVPQTITWRGRQFRVLAKSFSEYGVSYSLVAALSLEPVIVALRTFRNIALAVVPGLMLIACIGGFWLSRHALAPVDEITRVARTISAHNLSSRLPVPATGDELQRMSEAWNDVLARLDRALQRILRFTADASHELRTPLALVRSTAELALRRDRAPEDYRKALEDIHAETERMTGLIDSLLTLARHDATEVEMPRVAADLNRIVAETAQAAQPIAAEKGVRLDVRTNGNGAMANVNEAGIRRLLVILLDNALKYTPADGHITVSTSQSGGKVEVSVEDTGIGIQPDALPHIFERFYRADPVRGTEDGAGLGLSIAQMIARSHGARIEVESTPGKGSAFRLTL